MAQDTGRRAQGKEKSAVTFLCQALFISFLVLFALHPAPCTLHPVVWAAQIYPKSSKKPELLTAEKLITRLDRLEEEDRQLLQAMSEIKSELAIIKVRATK